MIQLRRLYSNIKVYGRGILCRYTRGEGAGVIKLNTARNNLVHGDANTPSFPSTKEKFEHVKEFLIVLDDLMQ